jgi:hypothetical protein
MTDAERLMVPFIPTVSRAVFSIAPERAEELNDEIFKQAPWDLDFKTDGDLFVAHPSQQLIEVRFSALLSLWAAANAALLFADAMMKAVREGKDTVVASPGTRLYEAMSLLAASKELIRNPRATWPKNLSLPDARAPAGTHAWYVNQLFLAATAWVLMHEVAHVHLKHEPVTTADILIQQEREADNWATKWLLEHAPPDLRRDFRAVACATGLAWVGLSDKIQGGHEPTHPHASQRLTASSVHFPTEEVSPALEMATHIVKAFFNPHAPVAESEHAAEAFEKILQWYRDDSRGN